MNLKEGIGMNYVEGMVINIVLLLFPMILYVIYLAYQRNLKQKEDELFFSMAVMTSLYLIMRFGLIEVENKHLTVLYCIPLLISYVHKQHKTAVGLSIFLFLNDFFELKIPFAFAFSQYLIYNLLYFLFNKKNLSEEFMVYSFILFKSFFFSLETFYIRPISPTFSSNFWFILLNMVLFYFVTYIVLVILHKGEEIISINQSLKDLEKEKFLRTALFKITHEIKNPIAVCKGYLDMIDLDDSKKVKAYIPIIKSEVERTLTLMEDYSTYAQNIKVNKDIMDLYFLLEDTKDEVESLFLEKGVLCSFHIPNEELYIEGDYNRLKQVFINVFKNAMEAKDETKQLEIKLDVERENEQVKIKISDNGVGISEENLKKLSELFFTTKANGTGLGVALSKEIIQLHEGTLSYSSKEGEGTTVTIMLPVLEELNAY